MLRKFVRRLAYSVLVKLDGKRLCLRQIVIHHQRRPTCLRELLTDVGSYPPWARWDLRLCYQVLNIFKRIKFLESIVRIPVA